MVGEAHGALYAEFRRGDPVGRPSAKSCTSAGDLIARPYIAAGLWRDAETVEQLDDNRAAVPRPGRVETGRGDPAGRPSVKLHTFAGDLIGRPYNAAWLPSNPQARADGSPVRTSGFNAIVGEAPVALYVKFSRGDPAGRPSAKSYTSAGDLIARPYKACPVLSELHSPLFYPLQSVPPSKWGDDHCFGGSSRSRPRTPLHISQICQIFAPCLLPFPDLSDARHRDGGTGAGGWGIRKRYPDPVRPRSPVAWLWCDAESVEQLDDNRAAVPRPGRVETGRGDPAGRPSVKLHTFAGDPSRRPCNLYSVSSVYSVV